MGQEVNPPSFGNISYHLNAGGFHDGDLGKPLCAVEARAVSNSLPEPMSLPRRQCLPAVIAAPVSDLALGVRGCSSSLRAQSLGSFLVNQETDWAGHRGAPRGAGQTAGAEVGARFCVTPEPGTSPTRLAPWGRCCERARGLNPADLWAPHLSLAFPHVSTRPRPRPPAPTAYSNDPPATSSLSCTRWAPSQALILPSSPDHI